MTQGVEPNDGEGWPRDRLRTARIVVLDALAEDGFLVASCEDEPAPRKSPPCS